MKVEIVEAKYPRKATEYAVRILSDEGKYLFCARPYTPYRIECELIAKVFEQ